MGEKGAGSGMEALGTAGGQLPAGEAIGSAGAEASHLVVHAGCGGAWVSPEVDAAGRECSPGKVGRSVSPGSGPGGSS